MARANRQLGGENMLDLQVSSNSDGRVVYPQGLYMLLTFFAELKALGDLP
jgi:hypothetical protein